MQSGEFLEFNDRIAVAERFGAPFYTYHRADLLDALATGLDPTAIHLGHRLVGVKEQSEGIELCFANGRRHTSGLNQLRCTRRSIDFQIQFGNNLFPLPRLIHEPRGKLIRSFAAHRQAHFIYAALLAATGWISAR